MSGLATQIYGITCYNSTSIDIPHKWLTNLGNIPTPHVFANKYHVWKVSEIYYYISVVVNIK